MGIYAFIKHCVEHVGTMAFIVTVQFSISLFRQTIPVTNNIFAFSLLRWKHLKPNTTLNDDFQDFSRGNYIFRQPPKPLKFLHVTTSMIKPAGDTKPKKKGLCRLLRPLTDSQLCDTLFEG